MSLTLEQLIYKAVPTCNKPLVKRLLPYLEKYLLEYDISTKDNRLAFFLGQCAVESAYYTTLRELGGVSYFEKAYGKKVGIPPKDSKKRKDLNYWYIGRGLIQTTWDYNYKKVSDIVGIDFVEKPWLLEDTELAVKSACVFWKNNKLNDYADANDIRGATKKINGGYNHLNERTDYIKRFQKLLAGDNIEGLPVPKRLSKSELEVIQTKLADAGYHEVGIPNGEMGSRTVAALAAFKADNGLPVNDQIDDDTLAHLDAPQERPISEERANGTPEDDASIAAKRTVQVGAGGTALFATPEILNTVKPFLEKTEETKSILTRFNDVYVPAKNFVTGNPEVFGVLFFGVVLFFGFRAWRTMVKDYRSGKKF